MGYDRFGLCTKLKMLVFYYSCEWSFSVGIVHYGIPLIILLVQQLVVEPKASIFQLAMLETEIFIDLASVNNGFRQRFQFSSVLEEVNSELHVYTF